MKRKKFIVTQGMKDCVLRHLRPGKKNAVTAEYLEKVCGICPERHSSEPTRRVIKALIVDGYPIASCSKGYYLSDDREELLQYEQSLHERADQIEVRAAMIRTIAENLPPPKKKIS